MGERISSPVSKLCAFAGIVALALVVLSINVFSNPETAFAKGPYATGRPWFSDSIQVADLGDLAMQGKGRIGEHANQGGNIYFHATKVSASNYNVVHIAGMTQTDGYSNAAITDKSALPAVGWKITDLSTADIILRFPEVFGIFEVFGDNKIFGFVFEFTEGKVIERCE